MPSTSRSRGSGRGPDGAPRAQVIAPMSERQQLALVMQISSQDAPPATPTPAEERKRTRQQRNERGETPLHVAAIRGDHDQVKKLLDQGQDPDVPDFAGWTPLHEACSYGWYQVVVVLVNGGANVNVKGLDDDTPLHDATTSGNLKMVKFLVEHGADPFVKNTKGKMPSDYAAPHIFEYLQSLKDNNARAAHVSRARDDSGKKGGCNASGNCDSTKRNNMETLAQGERFDGKDVSTQEKGGSSDNRDDNTQISCNIVSSTQDDSNKRPYDESNDNEAAEDEASKRKKRKDNEEKEPMGKPAPVPRSGTGRILTGSKPPGPASKTGAIPLGKSGGSQNVGKGGAGSSSGKGGLQAQGKGGGASKSNAQGSHQGKSSGGKGSLGLQVGKQDRKSPVASPKPNQVKDNNDDDDQKSSESAAPKVPPLKIVIPGGASGSGSRNEQEEGQRGSGKGRGSISTLPYVIPCTSTDTGQTSDSSDGNSDEKRAGESGKAGQRVLRSHRTNDGEKDKERTSPQTGNDSRSGASHAQAHLNSNKSPTPSGSAHDDHVTTSGGRGESSGSVELHPRKRKIKASKDGHSRDSKSDHAHDSSSTSHHNITHSNPYQMYLHIRKQIDRRQKTLFPVKPKPPKDFNKYMMNRCTYSLLSNASVAPTVRVPPFLNMTMTYKFRDQEEERCRLRIQHQIEKEKLVLAVEQEILRVHGRAERAVANQSLPYSVCTILRDREVYNVLAPEQEEKRNAQRSRCNGRQINSWLQEVDDKWEKIKEGMLRRQHHEAQTLHAVQKMGWEWKLKECGLCDYKTTPKIDPTHVPQIHVSNFDLPA
ncbi:unnamed protein product [Arctia plantaginis]|uniref:Ankyrin repeat domain-containing protein 11 n=1 Tax=Arctia plantaginis TaxID=874455 RepID=A0A8S0Z008_ARCPL|nr:unnamed protein product [Arctia plantaginis]